MNDKYTRERDVPGQPQTTRFAEHEKRQAKTNNLGLMASESEPDLSDQTSVDIDTKLAKALLPDGKPLRVPKWIDSVGDVHYDEVQSLVGARSMLSGYFEKRRMDYSEFHQEAREMIAEAIAAKEDKTVEQVLDEAATRAAKRK